MTPWSKRPGEKVIITRRAIAGLIHHLESPKMLAPIQFREDANTIRDQLADRTNVYEK